jgi:hypothetical protein
VLQKDESHQRKGTLSKDYNIIAELHDIAPPGSTFKDFRTGKHDEYTYTVERDHVHICDFRFLLRDDGTLQFSCWGAKNGGADEVRFNFWLLDKDGMRLLHSPQQDTSDDPVITWGYSLHDSPNSHNPPVTIKDAFPKSMFPIIANFAFRAWPG